MRMASSVGSAAGAGAEISLRDVAVGATGAFFFAAGFFAFGFAVADRDFFFGPAVPVPLSAADSEPAASAPFSDSIFDFLATIFVSN